MLTHVRQLQNQLFPNRICGKYSLPAPVFRLASHVYHFRVFRMVKCRKASSKQQRAVFETWALLLSRVHNSETKLRNHGYASPRNIDSETDLPYNHIRMY